MLEKEGPEREEGIKKHPVAMELRNRKGSDMAEARDVATQTEANRPHKGLRSHVQLEGFR